MPEIANGQVDKVIKVIASSDVSWEAAARAAVSEAALTVRDMRTARVTEADVFLREGATHYRLQLEMAFRIDRNRIDNAGQQVQVQRILVVANQTLASLRLETEVIDRIAAAPTEFHVLVPQTPTPTLHADPSGMIDPSLQESVIRSRALSRQEAETRLADFRQFFRRIGGDMTGEVSAGDPVAAVRRVLERAAFDEIIVSTLPPGVSRWLKLDLPNRLARAFSIPVTPLIDHRDTT